MKTRTKVFYKILNIITLAIPVPLYLILVMTIFSVKPDYTIHDVEINDISVVGREEGYFITTDIESVVYDGIIVFDNELGAFGLVINDEEIVKIGKKMYSLERQELIEIDVKKIRKQEKVHWGIPFIVGVIALLIVALVVSGKMQWQKKHPKVAVAISLGLATIILKFINMIAANMYNVFLISLISWLLFMIQDTIYVSKQKAIETAKAERTLNEYMKRG